MKAKACLFSCRVTFADVFACSLLGWLLVSGGNLHAQTVNFPDPNLEAAVRANLPNPPPGDITVADMVTLTNLPASNWNIRDTTGLETAHQLAALELTGNPVTNYSGFAGLTNLTLLRFDYGSVSNLTFLTGLTQLETLEVYQNHIADLTPLAALIGLKSLQLDWNPVTNHAVLAGLTNLESLSLAGNSVSQLDFITPLPRLQHLGLYVNQVQDLSLLTGCTNLWSLSLGWNGVTNPAVLAQLPQLAVLTLNGNSLTNVPYLAGLTNLTELGLDYTELADMSPLTNLTRLAVVNVGENFLTRLPDLASLTNLETFMMAGNQITDLSPVTNLPAMLVLHAQRNRFSSVAPLAGCPWLERLLLSGNNLTNLAELSVLTNLHYLQLREMPLTNLAFVAPLAALNDLDIGDNRVADLSSLTNLPDLHFLSVERNRLVQIGPLLDCPSLWAVNLRENALVTNAPAAAWNVITNLQARGVVVEYDPQYPPPSPLQFVAQPANRSAFISNHVEFAVSVTGGTPGPSFRWQKDGADLADGGRITGADTDTLNLENVTVADTGHYRVRVWDDWAATNSCAAELLIVTSVVFADTNLETAVRTELGIDTGPLTPADLADLSHLDASYRGITNLAGLEAAANLVSLNLSGNPSVADFTPLTFLAALHELAVNDAGLDHLNWVADLRSLHALQVNANFIEDLSPLRPLANLVSFSVTENQVMDIEVLLDLPALVGEVQLSWNRLDTNATSAAWAVITNLMARGATVNYDPQFAVPLRPVILTQPASVVALPGDNVSFSIVATSAAPALNFRWQKHGVNLADGPGLWGADSEMLHLDNVDAADAGSYRVRVWDEYGVTNSRTVTLRLITSVAFVDPRLEQAVRDRLGISTTPLTPADLATMTWLDAFDYGITNLSGIEAAVNLSWLSLRRNREITDFTPLTALWRLTYLELNDCDISDIAFVATMPPLDELHLWRGNITDISPLAVHSQLTRLNLAYHTGITNLEVLNGLTNLTGLWLEGTAITNISFAGLMPNLLHFSFEAAAVHDLSPLAGAPNLEWLDLANNGLTNAAPLAGCTNLLWLSAGNNQIADLGFVTNLRRLWFLSVDRNVFSDLSPLAGLTNLTWLDVGWNPATNVAPISSLTRLTDLHVWNLGLSNASFLAPLTNLLIFDAGDNALPGLPPYPHLNRLEHLLLDHNPLTNLSFIAGMTNLFNLRLNGTGVRDLNPLAGKTNLHELGVAGNGLTNITPLATLPYLAWVTLYDNNLQNINPLAGQTNLNYLDLRLNLLNTNSASAAMTVIATLEGCGTQVDYLPQKDLPVPIILSSPTWLGGGQFRFTIQSAAGAVLQIWSSTNLSTWSSAGFVTNASGTTNFTDSAGLAKRKFYRAGKP